MKIFSKGWEKFKKGEKNLILSGKTWRTKKPHQKCWQKNLFFMNYFICILNAKMILRGKDFLCSKFLWKNTCKETLLFFG